MQDHEILDLYFAREEQAIVETDKSHGRVCMQVSMNILRSRPDAEECVNDTYLKAWNIIPPERPTAFRAFLCQITRNLSLDRLRYMHRQKRDKNLLVMLSELETCLPAKENEDGQLEKHLSAFLRTQEKIDRLLFVGRYYHAFSTRELARRTGLDENLVSVHLYRVRERLRRYLVERGYDL